VVAALRRLVAAAPGPAGILDVTTADTMPDGWQVWLAWHRMLATPGAPPSDEVVALEADRGRTLGYVRAVGRRRDDVELSDCCWPDPLRSFADSFTDSPFLRHP
jgi:hypothetical protein